MTVQKLGVGLLYNPVVPGFLAQHFDDLDFLEIIPDREWSDRGVSVNPRYEILEKSFSYFRRCRERKPMLCHSIGLSIGSADLFDLGHVTQIRRVHDELDFAWHSDHLSFSRLPDSEHELNTAISLPVPYDRNVLDMLTQRARNVMSSVPCEFLLENNVYYVDAPEQEMTEPEFLNRLSEASGCGILLDLHNVYVNSRNHGFPPEQFLSDLDLSRVVEIHLAGGDDLLGFYTDAHAGPVAPVVWDLLDETLRNAPSVRAVTFEFHESSYPMLKIDGIRLEIARARKIWSRYN